MNSSFHWLWGLLRSGYEKGNMSITDIIVVEYQKKVQFMWVRSVRGGFFEGGRI